MMKMWQTMGLSLMALVIFTSNAQSQVLAFPGAEGAGKYTVGGRGGVVLEVTNLNDSGPGSFREAVEYNGPRIVVFRVSGTIELQSEIEIDNAYITIAGQTAPGDGICLRGYQVQIQTIEVIIRYMRFRLGDETGVDTDCIWGRYRRNIIIDHCSASWSVDETMSFYGNSAFTLQYCLIAESLYHSNHPSGNHGYGGIWGGTDVSFHHNLFAHHSSRNPRFAGNQTATCVNVDYRNNVIYNWGFNSAYGGEGGTINMVANYYKYGPATSTSKRNRIVEPSDSEGAWFIEGNFVEGYPTITANNWAGGVQGMHSNPAIMGADSAHAFTPIPVESAEEAYVTVLENVGASFPHRDPVDLRIINDVTSGTATYDGHWYEIAQGYSDTSVVRGIIDSQSDVGGWPVLNSLPAPADDDHDGMPNWWEIQNGLNPDDPEDRNTVGSTGYPLLEEYLTEILTLPVSIDETELPSAFDLTSIFPNPFNNQTQIRFTTPHTGGMEISVYDLRGSMIRQLKSGQFGAGEYKIAWDGQDDFGHQVPSGVYLVQVKHDYHTQVGKMQLIK